MSDKTKLLLAYLAVIALMLLFASCNPAKRAARLFDKDRSAAAKYCADKFPVKDDTLYLQGGVIIDTIVTVKDSLIRVICPKSDTVTQVQQVVKFRTITVHEHRTDTVTVIRENKAREEDLYNRLAAETKRADKAESEAQKWKDKAKGYFQFILWLAIILLIIIILQLIKSRIKLF